jgi:hypothetical protein
MSKKKLVSICTLVVLVMMTCGIAEANWLETYPNPTTPSLPTWQYFYYPDIPGVQTYTHTIKSGPLGNYYLSLDDPTSTQLGGSAFGMAMGSMEVFNDVRVGTVVNVTGDASNNYHGLGARVSYLIIPPPAYPPDLYPGLVAHGYVMLINWQDGPTNLRIEVQKVIYNQNIMRTDFEMAVPGADHARSYYAELDVVGSNPVYVTGSLYEYKGGPLVARLPTMIDTNAQDSWEDADQAEPPVVPSINDVLPFTSGKSGIFAMHEGATPPGYHTTFDDISSISNGPAAVNPSPADVATNVPLDTDLSWKEAAFATSRDLWFGKAGNMQKVTPSPTGTFYDLSTLELGRTYEWRVDEIGSTVIGHTWSFSTLPCLVVEDFEKYTNTSPNIICETWKDGLGFPGHPGNGTGSKAGYRDPDYAEVTIIHGGKQSLPVDYNNTTLPYYSEVDRTFGTPQDWSAYGVKALTLWLKGYPSPPAGTFVESPAGTYTMTTSGTDIWNVPDVRKPTSYHDEFHYAYTQTSGNCIIIAKVESVSNTDGWAKAGVMVRSSTDANSPHTMMCITPANGAAFQYRELTAGASTNINQTGITAPYWVAIERQGDIFYGACSPDGSSWTTVGQMTITMTDPVCIGLSLTAHNAAATCTAVFTNVSINQSPPQLTSHQDIGMRSNTAAPLYATLQDSSQNMATVTNPDPNAVLTNNWQSWDIALEDFADVNLAAIKKITVGVGNRSAPQPGGTGTIYIDDIRLYPPRCILDRVKSEGDFTGDCFADYADLDKIAQQWLASGSNLEADANSDNNVNFMDYAVLADVWLQEVLWPR